jgi:hypothetical protein
MTSRLIPVRLDDFTRFISITLFSWLKIIILENKIEELFEKRVFK